MKKIIIILTMLTSILIYNEFKNNEVIIPDTAIRLRVIPNSNSSLDQSMKNKVKKYLEKNTYATLSNVTDIEEARTKINESLSNLDININKIFKDNKYNMEYTVDFGYNYFPEKKYRGLKYEEGYYESLVITIGEGKGDNWWCVLFPNLCLVDLENKTNVEYKSWIVEQINKIF
ncbi:MAG: stage II sporulation protein R [Firmicutes bacterium]|nr:stage II sporulation protein R [Bacillota bacterium]MDY5336213.1 stage II sporulation protein R [Bacilli bacterium]